MESDRLDPEDARRIMERAEAAPYVDQPAAPAWYPVVVGLWAAGLAAVVTIGLTTDRSTSPWILLLVALELVFLRWLVRRQGAMPDFRRPPREFRGVLVRYLVGVAAVLLATGGAAVLAGPGAAALAAFVTVTAGATLHERSFAAAAARTRERLG